ncbi:MAG: hypothetical protein Q7K34_02165 [archaeon]|nr:hypothetical protein [archaeon]
MDKQEISKETLQTLYWDKELSLKKIAKEFGMKSPNGIVYHMEKFKIPRRPSDRKDYQKNPFSGNLIEKAYLVGLRAGDINAGKKNNCTVIYATSTKPAQMKMLHKLFGKYAHLNEYDAKGGYTEKSRKLVGYLDNSFDFLVEKPQKIPEWILNDNELFYSFLSGYCDSEASWILTEHKKYGGKWKDRAFSLGTSDKTVLEQINQKLIELGFNSHLYLVEKKGIYGDRKRNLDLYRVMMSSHQEVIKLAQILLPLSKHEDKIKAMSKLIEYEKLNDEKKLVKKQNLGTIPMACVYCKHKKVWNNGFKKYKNKKYRRYKCPSCKKEFQRKLTNINPLQKKTLMVS